jgi:hypothetical protein
MVIGSSQQVTAGTPVLLATGVGGATRVVVYRIAFGSSSLLLAGESAAATWFEAPQDGSPVHFVLELGEELWADASSSAVAVACLVGSQ